MTTKHKTLNLKAVDGGDDSPRTFHAIITTPAVDREGDVLLPQGLNPSEFKNNPVVFYVHNYASFPIGKCVKLIKKDTHWEAITEVAERPADHQGEWIPHTVHALIKQGILNGVSVGFIPMESRKPTVKDQEMFGPDVENVISKWKLLEYSVTGMPCNQEALIFATKSLNPATRKSLGIDVTATSPALAPVVDVTPPPPPLEVVDASQAPAPVVTPSAPEVKRVTLFIHTTRKPTEAEKTKALKSGKLWI